MLKRINQFILPSFCLLLLLSAGCQKGTFDINDINPNVPSNVSPKFILSGALMRSAQIMAGGDADFAELYMGYWSVSGDYIPVTSTLTYQTTTGYYSDNWDGGYQLLKNYRQIEQLASSDPNLTNYVAMGKIMESFHFERLVDMYNNIPYSQALQGGTINYPTYDDAATVYAGVIGTLDTAIQLIHAAPATAESPGAYDIMFQGNMTMWEEFANTLILRTAMNLTKFTGGSSLITAALANVSSAGFLSTGQDATVNPGYTNASYNQQNPFWQDMGFAPNGAVQNNESYYRACDYIVKYMMSTNDTLRLNQMFAPGSATGVVAGRPFGSEVSQGQDNQHISGMGPGLLISPSAPAVIFPACLSYFLQAEATSEGYLPGGASAAAALYQTGVEESFRLLGVANSQSAADGFISSSSDPNVNITVSANPVQTIIMQEWVAMHGIDPVQSWDNWKRLGIPANLPVSIFAGTTAPHVPYRLLYSQTEFQYNSKNVAVENVGGYPDNINDKIFWMP